MMLSKVRIYRRGGPATNTAKSRLAYGAKVRRLLLFVAALVWAALCLAEPVFAQHAITEPSPMPLKLLAFGDSLTAGYMLPEAAGFPAVLQKALRGQGQSVTVVNGGVSGDTTTGGLARLDWTLGDGADAVIVELGANDMLRGVDPAVTEAALSTILERLKAKNIKVLLAGMRATPSLGKDYVAKFDAIYPALAKKYDVPLYPFFLDGMVQDSGQKLADGLHPNQRGVETIVAHILPSVDALLKTVPPKS
jgi:acyl-CoA thioesterase-1